jgi:hypothetical protein
MIIKEAGLAANALPTICTPTDPSYRVSRNPHGQNTHHTQYKRLVGEHRPTTGPTSVITLYGGGRAASVQDGHAGGARDEEAGHRGRHRFFGAEQPLDHNQDLERGGRGGEDTRQSGSVELKRALRGIENKWGCW